MSTKRLYLIRHASVEGASREKYLGRTDLPLSQAGFAEARRLGLLLSPQLREPTLWASPMLRTRQTLEELRLNAAPVFFPELQEIDFGAWEAKSFHQIVAADPEAVAKWSAFTADFRFPAGESLAEFLVRVERMRTRIREEKSREIVCVTHGGVISTLLCLFLGLHPSQYLAFHVARATAASLTIFDNGMGRLTGLNIGADPLAREFLGEWPA